MYKKKAVPLLRISMKYRLELPKFSQILFKVISPNAPIIPSVY